MSQKKAFAGPLEKVTDFCWRIPKSYRADMRVDGLVFADEAMIQEIRKDETLEQVANVATLPGIVKASIAMPDIHWGYGFSIGGVCATNPNDGGVISPGGVGYDINCGVRLVRSNLSKSEVDGQMEALTRQLFRTVPSGMGRGGRFHFSDADMQELVVRGPEFLVARGHGVERDLQYAEANGRLDGALPDAVSKRAYERGSRQCGTLGSGNHFLEVQYIDHIFDAAVAERFGLFLNQVCVMIHSGSRGFGYQVCDDTLREFRNVPLQFGYTLPDQQLACAPINSAPGQKYLGAMRAAANYAWCNRQLLLVQARDAFARHFNKTWEELGLDLVYDVAHNIAKFEEHDLDGTLQTVCVHRKGATRAFPPGHPELPEPYRPVGQPVLIPGDMGTASYVLVGSAGSMEQSFGTTCHGAGRVMSRTQAIKSAKGRRIDKELLSRGIIALAQSQKGLDEEQPDAYKDIESVVGVVHATNLSAKVARLRPLGVIKG